MLHHLINIHKLSFFFRSLVYPWTKKHV